MIQVFRGEAKCVQNARPKRVWTAECLYKARARSATYPPDPPQEGGGDKKRPKCVSGSGGFAGSGAGRPPQVRLERCVRGALGQPRLCAKRGARPPRCPQPDPQGTKKRPKCVSGSGGSAGSGGVGPPRCCWNAACRARLGSRACARSGGREHHDAPSPTPQGRGATTRMPPARLPGDRQKTDSGITGEDGEGEGGREGRGNGEGGMGEERREGERGRPPNCC